MACDSIKLLSVNVHGLRSDIKRRSLFRFIKENKYNLVCLQETYITKELCDKWKKEWGGEMFSHEFSSHSSGQIILMKKSTFDNVTLTYNSRRIQIVEFEIQSKKIAMVNVYAPNKSLEKQNFMDELATVVQNIDVHNIVVCGDFNCVLDNNLDIITGDTHPNITIKHFKDFVEKCDLYDSWRLFHSGEKEFTWSKQNPMSARRLDYIFVTSSLFDKTVASNITSISSSDHRGCTITVKLSQIERGPGYWKFNNDLLRDIEYVNKMNEFIDDFVSDIEANDDYQCKWDLLKINIKTFTMNYSKLKSNSRRNKLTMLYADLNQIDRKLANDPNSHALQDRKNKIKLEIELDEHQRARAAQTRARVKWVEEGEKNSKYFLSLEKAKANSKIMEEVLDDNNRLITNQQEIMNVQKCYFSTLYKQRVKKEGMEQNLEIFLGSTSVSTISVEQKMVCEGLVTEEELLHALKKMNSNSAPGCDGITTEFLKMFWGRLKGVLQKSFNAAFEKKQLSSLQKKAIITLIHKGKELPRNNLKNWRPISLTNTDYKLLAKCLAVRLANVIDSVVSHDQVAYIRGRQVSTLLRLIDDVIEHTDIMQKPGLLLTVDYSQAFDRISKDFMMLAFKKFGFGNDFLQWVQVLMSNTQSCISYCGWLSDYFDVNSGIRQGCPFSPLAFVLSLELLAIKIRDNSLIKGIQLGQTELIDNFIKIALFADDVTLFLRNEEDMMHALTVFQHFSVFSGLEINRSKSEAMWLGSLKNNVNTHLGFTWKKKIKILGVYFACDKSASLVDENWLRRLENIKRTIHSWEKRNLSVLGKIIVLKTFLLSQFIYIMQAFTLPTQVITEIDRLLFRFIWRKKDCNRKAFEKVRRNVLCSDYEHGGLNMISMRQLQTAALLQWVVRLKRQGNDERWKILPKNIFSSFGKDLVCFFSNVSSKCFKGMDLIQSTFWKTVLQTWLDVNKHKVDTPLLSLLWNNKHVTYQNNVLFFPDWIKGNIINAKDLYGLHGLLSFEDICNKIGRSPNRILEYNVVRAAVNKFQHDLHNHNSVSDNMSEMPYFHGKIITTMKGFRKEIADSEKTTPCCHMFWNRNFGIELDKKYWLLPRLVTKETRLRLLQWKVLHNIYPTNIMLCKMRVRENQRCSYCPDQVDYIEHFFYECPQTRQFWIAVRNYILNTYGTRINISMTEALFGIQEVRNASADALHKINHILLIAKMCISIFKKTNSKSPLYSIFENNLRIRKF